jgi:HSP20 family protein
MTALAPRRGGGGRQLAQREGRRRGDPLGDLQDRMGDLLTSFFADPFLAAPLAPAVAPVWVPPVDIEETQDSYILEMDLPGVKAEDVNIELRDGNELRISGQYRARERTGTMRRENRRGGDFEYDVILPGDINPDQVEATLEDGVLMLRMGKAQGGQARRIQVRGGTTGGQVGGTAAGAGTGAGAGTATGTRTASAAATGGAPVAGSAAAPVAGSAAEATTGGVSSAEAPPPGDPGSQTRVGPGGGPGRASK